MWPFKRSQRKPSAPPPPKASRVVLKPGEHPAMALIESWRMEGISLNPGASPQQLAELERVIGRLLHEDVAYFYSLANGMERGLSDQHSVSFWSIEQIVEERGEAGPEEIAFADVLINSWYFVLRIQSPNLFHVVCQGDEGATVLDYRAFLERYLEDPASLSIL